MKKLLSLLMIVSIFITLALSVSAYTRVRGYYRSNGTYVQPHYRTSPNSSFYDNWSTRGNYNPYTGSKGYKTYKYGW